MSIREKLQQVILNVPDFPKPGINFKDITPVLESPELCRNIVYEYRDRLAHLQIDAIAGVESRGFFFGMALAMELGLPFITIRKKGKLPGETNCYTYDLEYGSAEIEINKNRVKPGWRILIHDDLLATGGTAAATAGLLKSEGAEIAGFAFLIELSFLQGRNRLDPFHCDIINLISFDTDEF